MIFIFYRGWRWTLAVRECPCPVSSSNPCRESPATLSSSKTCVHVHHPTTLWTLDQTQNLHLTRPPCSHTDFREHSREPSGPQSPASSPGEGRGAVLAGQRRRPRERKLGPAGVDPGARAVRGTVGGTTTTSYTHAAWSKILFHNKLIFSLCAATCVQLCYKLPGTSKVPAQWQTVQSQEQQGALRLPVQRLPAPHADHQTSGLVRKRQGLQCQVPPAVSHVQNGEALRILLHTKSFDCRSLMFNVDVCSPSFWTRCWWSSLPILQEMNPYFTYLTSTESTLYALKA